ncbi:MAG: hypothetical protein ACJ72A_14105, partial [Nocardioidaceae bacterium]
MCISVVLDVWLCWRVRPLVAIGRRRRLLVALRLDQVGEPPDLAFDRLDAVALELRGVPVDLLLSTVELVLDSVQALLE